MATTLSPADEEAVIRNRLLAQITVSKGEPPMRKLCSLYVLFSRAIEQGDKGKASEYHRALLQEIAGFEFQARKTAAVCEANRREQQQYERKQAQLESAIEQAQRDIGAKKEELEEARKVRQQNEEFEALRRVCMEQPRRSATRAEIEKVEQEIASIQADIVRANQAKELRKKQFALLMHVINETGESEGLPPALQME
ncbi:hypothetical protein WJX72_010160 [[Myrmecia] bisecta]|uniref:THO complex subunit 7 n=1 Tax=[Myrmecia] bisecta TaxID=41462 RepID=A0AAW1PX34_9CHLO